MSNPNPPSNDEAAHRAAGDGVEVTVDEARGSYRTGRAIWILVISVVLAVVLLGGYWALHAGRLQQVDAASGGGAHGRKVTDERVNMFNTQPPSPKQAPPGENSTSGANTAEATAPANATH